MSEKPEDFGPMVAPKGRYVTPEQEAARFAELRRQNALIQELVEVLVVCKKELDLMPKSFAYDIHPGRQIERVLTKAKDYQ